MCLTIKKGQEPQIASEDIPCYKVILMYDNYYITPYREMRIEIGCTYESELYTSGALILKHSQYYAQIDIGLHSFKNLKGATDDLSFLPSNDYTVEIVKCIIPKGATYYEGTFNNRESYASDKIKYELVINRDDIK